MVPVSIVIITKNEADIPAGCIRKAMQITDDIVLIVNDLVDQPHHCNRPAYRVYKETWDGYGNNKNKGIATAKHDWILSIDADEIPDDLLIRSLHGLKWDDPAVVYDIKFASYFGNKRIRFGSWGRDHHIRLFNRNLVKWSEVMVHETLVLPENIRVKRINGCLHHYSVTDMYEYDKKNAYYAWLSARKYNRAGRKANLVKMYFSPAFGFFKNYIIYLGFLDGRAGWNIAKSNFRHTRLKYFYLSQMENSQHAEQGVKESFVVEY
jgi:glycosyltransferase involved in cell wall biosynthesis